MHLRTSVPLDYSKGLPHTTYRACGKTAYQLQLPTSSSTVRVTTAVLNVLCERAAQRSAAGRTGVFRHADLVAARRNIF